MDEAKLLELIQKAINQLQPNLALIEKPACAATLYVVFPEAYSLSYRDFFTSIDNGFSIVAVLPDSFAYDNADKQIRDLSLKISLITRDVLSIPPQGKQFVTLFPAASRNLVIKTALCLADDYESKWASQCILQEQSVYMQRGEPVPSEKCYGAYYKKIESYYDEVRKFGVIFDRLPLANAHASHTDILGRETRHNIQNRKKQIIAAGDLERYTAAKQIELYPGDILTELASERAAQLGIKLIYV